jgi:hypothetical protein
MLDDPKSTVQPIAPPREREGGGSSGIGGGAAVSGPALLMCLRLVATDGCMGARSAEVAVSSTAIAAVRLADAAAASVERFVRLGWLSLLEVGMCRDCAENYKRR